ALRLVSALSPARRDFHGVGEEPLRRLSLHKIPERRDRGRHGGRGGHDERGESARAWYPAVEVGVPAWLRRRQRYLERQRARELLLFAGDPHAGQARTCHGRQEGRRPRLHRPLFLLSLRGAERLPRAWHRDR